MPVCGTEEMVATWVVVDMGFDEVELLILTFLRFVEEPV
jgi:hypothetical protein